MRFKKFLLIPILLFIYIFFIVDMLVSFNPTVYSPVTGVAGGGQPIGVGESVSILVTRPYFFKLIRLPVYTNYVGYIGDYHKMFFYFVGALTVVFVIFEFFVEINWGRGIGGGIGTGMTKSVGTGKGEWGDTKMKRGGSQIKRLAKAVGLGVVFGLIIFLLSADGGTSVGLGLLLMYLEYKLR